MSRNFLLYVFVHISAFIFSSFVSLYFGALYIDGDQYFYNLWFDNIVRLDFIEAYFYYASQVNSFEVVHFLMTWIGGKFFDKLILYTIVNVIFVYLLVEVFRKLNFHPLLAILIIITNFYIPVLLLAAERLKFGFLFLLLFMLVGSSKKKQIFVALTLVGHLQFLILWASSMVGVFFNKVFACNYFYMVSKKYLLAPLIGIVVLFFFGDYLFYKLSSYLDNGGVSNLLKPFVFMFLSIYCCKSKVFFIVGLFLGLSVSSYILGADRITIFACFVFFYFSSFRNKGVNLPTIFLVPYFGFKSIEFYVNIFYNGTGF